MKNQLKRLNNSIKNTNFSGTIKISINNETIYENAYGYSDRTNKIKSNINTRFGIASGTKLFTALGIMRLMEDGLLKLDDSPFDYIDYNFSTYSKKVSIRHLLSHTSGIPDYLDESNLNENFEFEIDVPWYKLIKPKDYFKIFPQKPMEFFPGEKFRYNNSAFILLAEIIESLTGSYTKYIENEILKRAEMNDSGFFMLDRLPINTANGYIDSNNDTYKTNIYSLPIIGGGDGGLFTNVIDMDSFWRNLFEGKIISKENLEMMIKPHFENDKVCYGLGVWLEKNKNGYIPFIEGQDPGISFKSYFYPENKITYTIISNTANGVWPVDKMVKEYLKELGVL